MPASVGLRPEEDEAAREEGEAGSPERPSGQHSSSREEQSAGDDQARRRERDRRDCTFALPRGGRLLGRLIRRWKTEGIALESAQAGKADSKERTSPLG
jgi:hypothetical protein